MKKKAGVQNISSAYIDEQKNQETGSVSEPSMYYGMPADPYSANTIRLMGMEGKPGFGQIMNENDFIKVIRNGVPKQAMMNLMNATDITLAEMAGIIHTTDRTLRRYTMSQKLPQQQSEGIIEMAMLYNRGQEVFGSLERFKRWMNTELRPFGNKKPKDFLDTSIGMGMILDEMGRIEHGIFA